METNEFFDAVRERNYEKVLLFIHDGIDVNMRDEHGRTALMVAAEKGYPEIAELLIDYGADVNARDNHGRDALYYAIINTKK